jgi:hypothetical protein
MPGDKSIVYQTKSRPWSRRSLASGSAGEGELAGAFEVPRRFRLHAEPDSASAGDLLTLQLRIRAQDRPQGSSVAAEVVAQVGRDRRLLPQ